MCQFIQPIIVYNRPQNEYGHKVKRGAASGQRKTWDYFHNLNELSVSMCTRGVALYKRCCAHLSEHGAHTEHELVESTLPPEEMDMGATGA